MKAEGTRIIRRARRALLAAFASALLASCATSGSDVPFGLAAADIAPLQAQPTPSGDAATGDAAVQPAASEAVARFMMEEGDPVLPDMVAAGPGLRDGSDTPVATETAMAAREPAPAAPTPAERPAVEAQAPAGAAQQAAAPAAGAATAAASEAPVQLVSAQPEAPKKRGFLSSFFAPAPSPALPAPQNRTARPLIDPTVAQPAIASAAAQPIVQLASGGPAARPLVATHPAAAGAALPGVREGNALYEISRRSGMDDDSDIDLHEGDEPGIQVASAAGLARLAPNGLMKQTDHVDVSCLKPSLVRVLKAVEKNYGRKVVVTSGYRSPDRNKRARGARNSLHMYCAAADVQVEGVSKWELAGFVRSMPGRGGVGTYCHTDSVHIDVGPERDWNWRCRRRK